jgi:hypothetical protein
MNYNKIYFVTDDTFNKKNLVLINKLEKIFKNKISIISPKYSKKNPFKIPQINIETSKNLGYYMLLWSKISFLFSKIKKTTVDYEFPKRNIYSGNYFSRLIVNLFWKIKRQKIINNLLPGYDVLFFLPLVFYKKKIKNNNRLFIIDSLPFRYYKFSEFVKTLYNSDCEVIYNVNSWDNPFYSQFFSDKSKYIAWSENMINDIENIHDFHIKKKYYVGPYPFFDFYRSRNVKKEIDFSSTIQVGYACAFCDEYMMEKELSLITRIGKELEKLDINILVRPYPSISVEKYNDFKDSKNIFLYEPTKITYTDRFGDGREKINFSSDDERHFYNQKCDIFLSIGTSYTIEAAIDQKPIFQFYMTKNERSKYYEKDVFERIDLSDHVKKYYLSNLQQSNNYSELYKNIKNQIATKSFSNFYLNNKLFLDSFGFNKY